MFESAEIGHEISKQRYKREEPKLRQALLEAQYKLLEHGKFPVLLIVGGVDGAGKGETVNLFNEWMDPRHLRAFAFGRKDRDNNGRPVMSRYWRSLPPKGKIGIFFGSWYSDPIVQRVYKRIGRAAFERELDRIRRLERMLVAEGTVVLKLWFHMSRAQMAKRLKKLAASKRTAWRVTPDEWKHYKEYKVFRDISEDALRETSTGAAPWHVIEGYNEEYRSLTAGNLLLSALRHRLEGEKPMVVVSAPPARPSIDGRNVLKALDYTAKLSRAAYDDRLDALQAELAALTRHRKMRKRSVIAVFEGMDAAGKGSTIRRVTRALDARFYRVIPIAAPTEEERAQPYLWRFWRHVPSHGNFAIFDRSWYGRVLVERVEGFAAPVDWMRAYHEINEFEAELAEAGGIVVKFWMAITPDEQLKRFKARKEIAYKRYKITDEDWRNRKKWPQYEQAICDMVERTSTDLAPWNLISANDKLHARVEVLDRLVAALKRA
ncbi:polyphosphate:AMP phosphotransferase [Betaproteobacteria bacterium GR16-43]|nr:polyphosphate:AMP phosphotransferase [Betaproteobacteria bacterium GR16-43]